MSRTYLRAQCNAAIGFCSIIVLPGRTLVSRRIVCFRLLSMFTTQFRGPSRGLSDIRMMPIAIQQHLYSTFTSPKTDIHSRSHSSHYSDLSSFLGHYLSHPSSTSHHAVQDRGRRFRFHPDGLRTRYACSRGYVSLSPVN
jgi:hypothetical protein